MKAYGKELIIDMHKCDKYYFNRRNINNFFDLVCKATDMKKEKLCWWDDLYTPAEEKQTEPHLAGTSAVQFIKTSNITIHTLDLLGNVYINFFSCKSYDSRKVIRIAKKIFKGKVVSVVIIERK